MSSQHDLSAASLNAAPSAEQPGLRQAHRLVADDAVVDPAEIMQRLAQRLPAQPTPKKED